MSVDSERLLRLHQPILKFDSHECYFADSAAEWTDNAANRLLREDGTAIAEATPDAGGPQLSLPFLGPDKYGDEAAVQTTDAIGDAKRDYAKQALSLHEEAKYRNRIYGRSVVDSSGRRWLQYWFFYFYNDFNLIGSLLGAGRHEGDWEMIQLRLAEDSAPDRAVYAQHKHAGVRAWDQVDLFPGTQRPIVYVARGSHASYFEPGRHWTGDWFDWADGKRRSPEQRLEIVEDDRPEWRWLRWPGRWGGTKLKDPHLPFDADSPVGPGLHGQWGDPSSLAPEPQTSAGQEEDAQKPPPPTLSQAKAEYADHGFTIHYAAHSPQAKKLRGLVVTVNSPDEAAPPATHTIEADAPAGVVELSLPIDPSKRYDVYVSAAFDGHLATESKRTDLEPRAGNSA
jgi:VPS62-like protein